MIEIPSMSSGTDWCWNRKGSDKGRPLAYTIRIELESDDAENTACFTRRGFDFAYAGRAFFDPRRIVVQDWRQDYGEDRCRLLGMIDGRAHVVIYTVRASVIRIISARDANKREIANYEHNSH